MNKKEVLINKIARGHNQKSLISDLVLNGVTKTLGDYITSQKYYNKYLTSYANAVSRLEKEGWNIEYIPGIRGGAWTAQYKVVGVTVC